MSEVIGSRRLGRAARPTLARADREPRRLAECAEGDCGLSALVKEVTTGTFAVLLRSCVAPLWRPALRMNW
eukprot:scaffold224827_cov32-Tisochrysis_lutea.AAC.4